MNGIGFWRTGLPVTITQTGTMHLDRHRQQPAQPDRQTGTAGRPDDRPLVRPRRFRAARRPTGTFGDIGRNTLRGPERLQHRPVARQAHEDRPDRHRAAHRGLQRPQPPAVRAAQRPARQRRLRDDHGVGEPELRHLRDLGAADPARRQAAVLAGALVVRLPARRRAGRPPARGASSECVRIPPDACVTT